MRERNQRLKDIQVVGPPKNSADLEKGIHPDERPIKSVSYYNFDDMPVAPASNHTDSNTKATQEVAPKVENDGGLMMAFDFSNQNPKPAKKTFLRRKKDVKKAPEAQPSPTQDTKPEESPSKQTESDNKPQKKFLKRKQGLVYDPLKAVKEAKLKKRQELEEQKKSHDSPEVGLNQQPEGQNETLSVVNFQELQTAINNQKTEIGDFSILKRLSKEESFRQQAREETKSKSSGKNNLEKKVTAPVVANNFQDLNYLKQIPKRVD